MFDYVQGIGPKNSKLCVFGLAPNTLVGGLTGIPLTSKVSGTMVREALKEINILPEDIYISNVIKTPTINPTIEMVMVNELTKEIKGLNGLKVICGLGKIAIKSILLSFDISCDNIFDIPNPFLFYLNENTVLYCEKHPSYFARKGERFSLKKLDYIINGELVSCFGEEETFLRFKKGIDDGIDIRIKGITKFYYTKDSNGKIESIYGDKYNRKPVPAKFACREFVLNQKIFSFNFKYAKIGYYDVETLTPANRDHIFLSNIFDPIENKFYSFIENLGSANSGMYAGFSCTFEKGIMKKENKDFDVEMMDLKDFPDFLKEHKYDILLAWNAPFDKEKTENQFGFFRDIYFFDLLHFYKKLVRESRESYGLDFIANFELGEGKLKVNKKNMREQWNRDRKNTIEYNLRDCLLCYEIDKKLGIFDFFKYLCEYINGTFVLTEYNSRMIRHLLIRKNERYIPPIYFEGEDVKFVGGYVHEPVIGFKENVKVFDFKSWYPSIIFSFNLGLETFSNKKEKDNALVPGNPYSFIQDKDSILKSLCRELMSERDKIRKQLKGFVKTDDKINLYRRQYLIKVINNTLFGALGDTHFFQYKREVAETITCVGRAGVLNLINFVTKNNYGEVIYCDTDSIFLITKNIDVLELEKLLNIEIKRWAKEVCNLKESVMEIKYEKEYKRLLMVGKKKYAGLLEIEKEDEGGKYIEEKIEKRGLECIRSDHSIYSKRIQLDLVNDILKNGKITIKYPHDARDIMMVPLTELAIPKKLGKDIKEFKTLPIHIRSAKLAKEPIEKGETIYYLNLRHGEVVCLNGMDEKEIEKYRCKVDFDYLWEKTIKHKINIITTFFEKKPNILDYCK